MYFSLLVPIPQRTKLTYASIFSFGNWSKWASTGSPGSISSLASSNLASISVKDTSDVGGEIGAVLLFILKMMVVAGQGEISLKLNRSDNVVLRVIYNITGE